jgi:hypothetical protein
MVHIEHAVMAGYYYTVHTAQHYKKPNVPPPKLTVKKLPASSSPLTEPKLP